MDDGLREVLVKLDGEGYYVNCPWLDGEKIGVNGECEFVDGGSCSKFYGKVSKGEDYVLCGYKQNQKEVSRV